ncbi:MAG: hypothetical protein IT184_02505 [Acidobacteria bacterium]|nr:hypothetical protein [Acidobacteriota bacterium]
MPNRAIVFTSAALLAACSVSRVSDGPTTREHRTIALAKAEVARVKVDVGAGTLQVRGGAPTLLEADFAYNVPEWKPSIEQNTFGSAVEIAVTQPSKSIAVGRPENRWDLALNDTVPVEVEAHLGAGEAKLELGRLRLRDVKISVGAGRVDLDLRGTPAQSYKVEVEGGVGQATIYLPATVAISAMATGGIGSVEVQGLERADGRWRNPRVTSGPVTIGVDVHGGVGQVRLIAE